MARFWDAHDLTDFEDQLEEVAEPVFEHETPLKIHLPSREAETVEEIARSRGVGPADLIRQWVLERIQAS